MSDCIPPLLPTALTYRLADPQSAKIENQTPVCLRSDHPFPPREVGGSPYRYFELAIQTRGPPHDDKFVITIGFCSEVSDMAAAHTGWKERSVGYHSDDGGLFEESGWPAKEYKKKYGSGSTVGCGIDYAEGKYFFTLDGDIISKITPSLLRVALPRA